MLILTYNDKSKQMSAHRGSHGRVEGRWCKGRGQTQGELNFLSLTQASVYGTQFNHLGVIGVPQ